MIIDVEVGIIDLGISNIGSVVTAFQDVASKTRLVHSREDLADLNYLVLPGNGAFSEGMTRLKNAGLVEAIRDFVSKPACYVLGICLGMQLLATTGTEFYTTSGLNLIPGIVRRAEGSALCKIPHIGWNSIEHNESRNILRGIPNSTDFYFAHSYVFDCENLSNLIATTSHSEVFAAAVCFDNIYGVQFHPEKSSRAGRQILYNFCSLS